MQEKECLIVKVSVCQGYFFPIVVFHSSGPFLYMALTGVMDGSAIILTTPLATRCGRKVMIFGGMFGGACLFLLELLIPEGESRKSFH